MCFLLCGLSFLSTLSLRRATRAVLREHGKSLYFYPRSPCGERHQLDELCRMMGIKHFYPRSPCGERPNELGARLCDYCISIHALLAESDVRPTGRPAYHIGFLSTLSLRRATRSNGDTHYSYIHFYPRSPCGERQPSKTRRLTNLMISIHALLAESDKCSLGNPRKKPYFYPRSPCGERRFYPLKTLIILPFLSTLSLRRATRNTKNNYTDYCDFYPRSPCGERLKLIA